MNKQTNTTIERSKVRELLKSAGSTFFTVEFIKKDNTLRKLNGRLKVKSHLHGGKSTTAHLDKYITIFDVQKEEYRNVNLETIQTVKLRGTFYEVI